VLTICNFSFIFLNNDNKKQIFSITFKITARIQSQTIMKYLPFAVNVLTKYPQLLKNPTFIIKNPTFIIKPFMTFIKIFLFLFIIAMASSCKTCNCPAYSYQKNFNTMGKTKYINTNPTASKKNSPDRLIFSSTKLVLEVNSI